MEKGALSLAQYFGNKLAVFLIKLFWGYAYSDLGPMRAITYTALQRLQMQDRDFGWTIEMQIKALDCNLAITQIDVPYRNRFQGESKVSGTISGTFGAGWKILSRIFYYRFLVKKVSKP
jgi:ABC-type microcin C transport system permease subunit YejB